MFDANSIAGQVAGATQNWLNGYDLNGEKYTLVDCKTSQYKNKKDEVKKRFVFVTSAGDSISVPMPAEGKQTLANYRYVADLIKVAGGVSNVMFQVDEFDTETGTAKCLWLCNERGERLFPSR